MIEIMSKYPHKPSAPDLLGAIALPGAIDVEGIRYFAERSLAPNTLRGYACDWAHFERWCAATGHTPMPAAPQVVATYLTAVGKGTVPGEEGTVPAYPTINRRLCAIGKYHRWNELSGDAAADPTKSNVVRAIMGGLRRDLKRLPKQKDAVDPRALENYVKGLDGSLASARDAALLSVGFSAGLRRSELVGIDVEHMRLEGRGITLLIPHSKTDQAGEGRYVAIPAAPGFASCPLAAMRRWLARAGIASGPVFRSVHPTRKGPRLGKRRLTDQVVGKRVKAFAQAMGLDPTAFAGHSLRAGFVTAAYDGDADLPSIMDVTGHKSFDMVRRYIRAAEKWKKDGAGTKVVRG